jgi:hypothetical protein
MVFSPFGCFSAEDAMAHPMIFERAPHAERDTIQSAYCIMKLMI